MPILTRSEPRPTTVHCVREVRVSIPLELLGQVVRFYTRLVGLRAWSRQAQIPGGWGAGDPRQGIYFQFRHDHAPDPLRRRLTVLVDSLERVERRLQAEQWPYVRLRGLCWSDRCLLVTDPAGHRIELRQLQLL